MSREVLFTLNSAQVTSSPHANPLYMSTKPTATSSINQNQQIETVTPQQKYCEDSRRQQTETPYRTKNPAAAKKAEQNRHNNEKKSAPTIQELPEAENREILYNRRDQNKNRTAFLNLSTSVVKSSLSDRNDVRTYRREIKEEVDEVKSRVQKFTKESSAQSLNKLENKRESGSPKSAPAQKDPLNRPTKSTYVEPLKNKFTSSAPEKQKEIPGFLPINVKYKGKTINSNAFKHNKRVEEKKKEELSQNSGTTLEKDLESILDKKEFSPAESVTNPSKPTEGTKKHRLHQKNRPPKTKKLAPTESLSNNIISANSKRVTADAKERGAKKLSALDKSLGSKGTTLKRAHEFVQKAKQFPHNSKKNFVFTIWERPVTNAELLRNIRDQETQIAAFRRLLVTHIKGQAIELAEVKAQRRELKEEFNVMKKILLELTQKKSTQSPDTIENKQEEGLSSPENAPTQKDSLDESTKLVVAELQKNALLSSTPEKQKNTQEPVNAKKKRKKELPSVLNKGLGSKSTVLKRAYNPARNAKRIQKLLVATSTDRYQNLQDQNEDMLIFADLVTPVQESTRIAVDVREAQIAEQIELVRRLTYDQVELTKNVDLKYQELSCGANKGAPQSTCYQTRDRTALDELVTTPRDRTLIASDAIKTSESKYKKQLKKLDNTDQKRAAFKIQEEFTVDKTKASQNLHDQDEDTLTFGERAKAIWKTYFFTINTSKTQEREHKGQSGPLLSASDAFAQRIASKFQKLFADTNTKMLQNICDQYKEYIPSIKECSKTVLEMVAIIIRTIKTDDNKLKQIEKARNKQQKLRQKVDSGRRKLSAGDRTKAFPYKELAALNKLINALQESLLNDIDAWIIQKREYEEQRDKLINIQQKLIQKIVSTRQESSWVVNEEVLPIFRTNDQGMKVLHKRKIKLHEQTVASENNINTQKRKLWKEFDGLSRARQELTQKKLAQSPDTIENKQEEGLSSPENAPTQKDSLDESTKLVAAELQKNALLSSTPEKQKNTQEPVNAKKKRKKELPSVLNKGLGSKSTVLKRAYDRAPAAATAKNIERLYEYPKPPLRALKKSWPYWLFEGKRPAIYWNVSPRSKMSEELRAARRGPKDPSALMERKHRAGMPRAEVQPRQEVSVSTHNAELPWWHLTLKPHRWSKWSRWGDAPDVLPKCQKVVKNSIKKDAARRNGTSPWDCPPFRLRFVRKPVQVVLKPFALRDKPKSNWYWQEKIRYKKGLVTLHSAYARAPYGVSPTGLLYDTPRQRSVEGDLLPRAYTARVLLRQISQARTSFGARLVLARRSTQLFCPNNNSWARPTAVRTLRGEALNRYSYENRPRGLSAVQKRTRKYVRRSHHQLFLRQPPSAQPPRRPAAFFLTPAVGFLAFQSDVAFKKNIKDLALARRLQSKYVSATVKGYFPSFSEKEKKKFKKSFTFTKLLTVLWPQVYKRVRPETESIARRQFIKYYAKSRKGPKSIAIKKYTQAIGGFSSRQTVSNSYTLQSRFRGSLRYRVARRRHRSFFKRMSSGEKRVGFLRLNRQTKSGLETNGHIRRRARRRDIQTARLSLLRTRAARRLRSAIYRVSPYTKRALSRAASRDVQKSPSYELWEIKKRIKPRRRIRQRRRRWRRKKRIKKRSKIPWWKRKFKHLRRLFRPLRKIGVRYNYVRKISWPVPSPQKREYRNRNWKRGRRLRRRGKNNIAKLFFREKGILPSLTNASKNLWVHRGSVRASLRAKLPYYALHYKLKARKWHTPRDVSGFPLRRPELSDEEREKRLGEKEVRHLTKDSLKRQSWAATNRRKKKALRKEARSKKNRPPKYPDYTWRDLELRTGYPATLGYVNQRRILRNSFITNRWWRPRPEETAVQHPFALTKVENQPKSFRDSANRDLYYTERNFRQHEVREYRTAGLLHAVPRPTTTLLTATSAAHVQAVPTLSYEREVHSLLPPKLFAPLSTTALQLSASNTDLISISTPSLIKISQSSIFSLIDKRLKLTSGKNACVLRNSLQNSDPRSEHKAGAPNSLRVLFQINLQARRTREIASHASFRRTSAAEIGILKKIYENVSSRNTYDFLSAGERKGLNQEQRLESLPTTVSEDKPGNELAIYENFAAKLSKKTVAYNFEAPDEQLINTRHLLFLQKRRARGKYRRSLSMALLGGYSKSDLSRVELPRLKRRKKKVKWFGPKRCQTSKLLNLRVNPCSQSIYLPTPIKRKVSKKLWGRLLCIAQAQPGFVKRKRVTLSKKVLAFKEKLRVVEYKIAPPAADAVPQIESKNFLEDILSKIQITQIQPLFVDLKDKERGTAYNSWITTRAIENKRTTLVHSSLEHNLRKDSEVYQLPRFQKRFPGTGHRKLSYNRAIRVYYRKVRKPRFRRVNSFRHQRIRPQNSEDSLSFAARYELTAALNLQRRAARVYSVNAFLPKTWRALSMGRNYTKSLRNITTNEVALTAKTKRRFTRLPVVKRKKRKVAMLRALRKHRRQSHPAALLAILKLGISHRKNTSEAVDSKNFIRRRRLTSEQVPPRWRRRKKIRNIAKRKWQKINGWKFSKYNRAKVAHWYRALNTVSTVKSSKRPFQPQLVSSSFENRRLPLVLVRKRWLKFGYSMLSKSRRLRIKKLRRGVPHKVYRKYPRKRQFTFLTEKDKRGRSIRFKQRWIWKKRIRHRRGQPSHRLYAKRKFRKIERRRRSRRGRYYATKRKQVKLRQNSHELHRIRFSFPKNARVLSHRTKSCIAESKKPLYSVSDLELPLLFPKVKRKPAIRNPPYIDCEFTIPAAKPVHDLALLVPEKVKPAHDIKRPSARAVGVRAQKAKTLVPHRARRGLLPVTKTKHRIFNFLAHKQALTHRTFHQKNLEIFKEIKKVTAVVKLEDSFAYVGYRVTTEIAEATSNFFPALISWRRKRQIEENSRTYSEAENRVLAVYWNLRFYLGQDFYNARPVLRDSIAGLRGSIAEELQESSLTRFYEKNDREARRFRMQAPWLTKKAPQRRASEGFLRFWFPRLFKFYLEDNDRFSALTFTIKQAQRTKPTVAAAEHWKTQNLFSLEDVAYNRFVNIEDGKSTSYYENMLKTDRRQNFVQPGVRPTTQIVSTIPYNRLNFRTNFFKKNFSTQALYRTDRTSTSLLRGRLEVQRQYSECIEDASANADTLRQHRAVKTRLVARGRLRNSPRSDERPPGNLNRSHMRAKSPRTAEYIQRQNYTNQDVAVKALRVTFAEDRYSTVDLLIGSLARRTYKVRRSLLQLEYDSLAKVRALVTQRRRPSAVENQFVVPPTKKPLQSKSLEVNALRQKSRKYTQDQIVARRSLTRSQAFADFNDQGIAPKEIDGLDRRSILHYRSASQRVPTTTSKPLGRRTAQTAFSQKRRGRDVRRSNARFKTRSLLLRKKNKLVYGNYKLRYRRKRGIVKYTKERDAQVLHDIFEDVSDFLYQKDCKLFLRRSTPIGWRADTDRALPLFPSASASFETAVELYRGEKFADIENNITLLPTRVIEHRPLSTLVRKSNRFRSMYKKLLTSALLVKLDANERNIMNESRSELWAYLASRFFLKGRFLKNWIKDLKRIQIRTNWEERPEILFKLRRTRLRAYEWKESDRYFFKRGWANAFKLYPSERQLAPWLQPLRRRRTAYSTHHGEYRRYSYPREQKRVKPRQYYRKARFSIGTKRQYVSYRKWSRLRIRAYRLLRSLFEFRTTRAAQKHFQKLRRQKTKTTGFSRNLIGLGNRLDVNLRLLGFFKTVFWARRYATCGLVKINRVRIYRANYRLQPGDILRFDWGKVRKAQTDFRAPRPYYKAEDFDLPINLQALPGNFLSFPRHDFLVYERLPHPEDIKDNTRLCRWIFDSFRRDAGIGRGNHR